MKKVKNELLLCIVLVAAYFAFLHATPIPTQVRFKRQFSDNEPAREELVTFPHRAIADGKRSLFFGRTSFYSPKHQQAYFLLDISDEIIGIAINEENIDIEKVKKFYGLSALTRGAEKYYLSFELNEGENTIDIVAANRGSDIYFQVSPQMNGMQYLALLAIALALTALTFNAR